MVDFVQETSSMRRVDQDRIAQFVRYCLDLNKKNWRYKLKRCINLQDITYKYQLRTSIPTKT